MQQKNFHCRKAPLIRLSIYLAGLLAAAGYILLCLNGGGFPCVFERNFGILCPGCGASRAALALLRLDFYGAAEANPIFALAFYPILGLLFGQDLLLCIWNLCRGDDRISMLRFLLGAQEET